MAFDSNNNTVMRTSSGVEVRVSDSEPQITLRTPDGTSILLNEGVITLNAMGVQIVLANGAVNIHAARIALDAPIVSAQVIQCDTIIANSVVGASYTPGVGNVW